MFVYGIEKRQESVERLHRTMGWAIAAISIVVAGLNIGVSLLRDGRTIGEALVRPTILPFLVFAVVGAVSVMVRRQGFRVFHVAIFIVAGMFGSVVSEPGVLVGPFLFVFGLILMLQYGYFAKRGFAKLLTLSVLYSAIVIIGTDLYWEEFLILNGLMTVGAAALFAVMFYVPFADEVKDALSEARRMRHEVERNRVFVEFGRNVAGVVHNLRSSLNAVAGFADILAAGDDAERDDHARLLGKSVDDMNGMISNLLFAVRSSQATESRVIDFSSVIRGVIELRKSDLEVKRRVSFDLDLDDGCDLRCSPLEAMQLVQNLIQNACEATVAREQGTVSVSCRSHIDRVVFTCSDNGSGIPWMIDRGRMNCMVRHLFEIGKSTKDEGVGLGMVYVRELVSHLGGTWVGESTRDGTTFVLEFPRAAESVEPDASAVS